MCQWIFCMWFFVYLFGLHSHLCDSTVFVFLLFASIETSKWPIIFGFEYLWFSTLFVRRFLIGIREHRKNVNFNTQLMKLKSIVTHILLNESEREREKYKDIREFAHLTVAMFLSKIICKFKLSVFKFCYCLHMTFDDTKLTHLHSINKLNQHTHTHTYMKI